MSRLHKTLADYLVIAVSPAMIMVLIGSLIFFLVDVFYQGQHVGRLHYILSLFIFAAVLIGRISIEMGKEHAMMYAAPLALVTALALGRFVTFQGAAEGYAMLINLGLMGLIWYSAHKLTWDCTMVDESQDASGEGLLQRLGLDKGRRGEEEKGRKGEEEGRTGVDVSPSPLLPRSSSPVLPDTRHPPPATVEGVTGREDRPRPWWERLRNPPPRPHSPGASVVWFSLAALVLFGIGQLRIPASDLARRRYGFTMLFVYVACALGLLLTTSFLGLRRYLRQRRLQMPVAMAGLWIFIGCSLIAGVLGFAVLLPRPNPEYAISQVPWMTSPERGSSRYAVGKDAAEKDAEGSPTGQDQRPPEEQDKDLQPKRGSEGQQRPDAENAGKTQGKAPGEQDKGAGEQGKGGGEKGKNDGEQGRNGGERGKAQGDQDKGKSGDGGSNEKGPGRESGGGKGQAKGQGKGQAKDQGKESRGDTAGRSGTKPQAKGPPGRSGSSGGAAKAPKPPNETAKPPDGSGGRSAPRPPSPRAPNLVTGVFAWLGPVLKWLLYAALIAAAAYWLWRSRHELAAALRRLLEAWRDFWSWLFGGKRKEKAAAAEGQQQAALAPAQRFADFVDPFAVGTADRYRPDDLVRYSFEALEAWARENGLTREPDQTPYEFSRRVGAQVESLAGDLRTLADLYYTAAYARGRLSAAGVRPLAKFWASLRAQAAWTEQRQAAGQSANRAS
jgi:hypothetical protein